jgi:hypothetical protein
MPHRGAIDAVSRFVGGMAFAIGFVGVVQIVRGARSTLP